MGLSLRGCKDEVWRGLRFYCRLVAGLIYYFGVWARAPVFTGELNYVPLGVCEGV